MDIQGLENGILVETDEGVVCLSVDEGLASDFEVSVEDLQKMTTKLLTTEINRREGVSNLISTDSFADSDGFTSESSDTNSIFQQVKLGNLEAINCGPMIIQSAPSTSTFQLIDTVMDNMSSNISDSDTGSIITNTNNIKIEGDPLAFPLQSNKLPIKKRGGWPKGRKRKPELLHLPPKAPSTGYNLYLNDQRKLFKNSSLRFHEITKLIGNKWSSLSLEEKQPYLDRAEEEKKRYREEFRNYRQSRAYQLYLANKRRKRVQHNVLSESDMDATDEVDDEDNEELYCRTCDQWFHNHHNKREHLQGKQHMQSIAGAISKELKYDSDCGLSLTPAPSLSDIASKSSSDVPSDTASSTADSSAKPKLSVENAMEELLDAIKKRESEYKSLMRIQKEVMANNSALFQQLSSLKERESKLQKDLILLKGQEKDLDLKLFHLWKVPSLFIVTDLTSTSEDYATLD